VGRLRKKLTVREASRRHALAEGQVVPVAVRCIQCGICSYNCPVDIDVRNYARRGEAVTDRRCILCGECVTRCPRGTLRIEAPSSLVRAISARG
jgi:ferredoxin